MRKTSDLHHEMTEQAREAGREHARVCGPGSRDDPDAAWDHERQGGDWDDVLAVLNEAEARAAFVDGLCTIRADEITDAQLEALMVEAGAAGDAEQVGICRAALAGDDEARRQCAEVIDYARTEREHDGGDGPW